MMFAQRIYRDNTPSVFDYARSQPTDLEDLLSVLDEATNDLEKLMLHAEIKGGALGKINDFFGTSQKQLITLIREASQYFEHSKHLIGSKYRFEYKLNRAEAVFKESKKFKSVDPNW